MTAPPIEGEPVLALTGVTVDYQIGRDRIVRALDDVTLSARAGESVGLVGGTGSGKSTMAQVIMGTVRPTGGMVRVIGADPGALRGRALREHQRRVQIVPQDPYSSLDPRMRVADIVGEPLTLGARSLSAAHRKRVDEVLDLVGIAAARSSQFPHQFSGGQRQRLAIARALAPRPGVIVFDEPTSALDVSIRAQILNLLKRLQGDHNTSYLVISHDIASVAHLTEWIAVMHLGRIVEVGPVKTIAAVPAHPYTRLLLASVPSASGSFLDAARLDAPGPSAAPQPAGPTPGCKYVSRCALHKRLGEPADCRDVRPLLRPAAAGQTVACHHAEEEGEPA
jgi:oligopeptide/dipeptide ABC transporter ATP-binding protein